MKELLSTLCNNRLLIYEMAKRDIRDRYVGQIFGYLWFLVNSIFTVSVYIFLFAFVYKSGNASTENFSLYIISGIVPWLFLTETMIKGVVSISSNASLVKQVVFPIEVLPTKVVIASFVSFSINLMILSIVSLVYSGFSSMFFMLPVLIFSLISFSLGVVFVLSPVGGFLKDLKDLIQVFCSIGIYLVPIVYQETWLPRQLQFLSGLNPFSYFVYCFQDVFYYKSFTHPTAWIILPLISIAVCLFGYSIFRKVKLSLGNFI